MKTFGKLISVMALTAITFSVSAQETVTLRRITGAELKYLYEFPTDRGRRTTSEGVGGAFERCPSLSFVIIDKASSMALPNSCITGVSPVRYPNGKNVGEIQEGLSMSRDDYNNLRFAMRREYQLGDLSKDNTVFPISVIYVTAPEKDNSHTDDMGAEDTGNVQFSNKAGEASHPWISFETLDSEDFKLYMFPTKNETKPYYLNFQISGTTERFRLYATQVDYNLNIYQYENISVEPTADEFGGVDVAISHIDDDPVMQDKGAIELCVVLNDGSAVTVDDMMASTTRHPLYDADEGWKSSLKIQQAPAEVISRADETTPTTAWLQPCYTLEYNNEKHSVPVGRITSVQLNNPSGSGEEEEDPSTGISDVTADGVEDQVIYYNLQGQRVTTPRSGEVYIRVTPTSATKIRL